MVPLTSNSRPAKISIVIATYNAAEFLEKCLRSCIGQSWQEREILVIDGGSSDGTVDIIRKYAADIEYWHSRPDRGIYDAWNQALDHVTGSWVLFRGADDVFWSADSLERMATALPNPVSGELICYGTVVITDGNGHTRRILGEPWSTAGRRFFQEMSIPHPGTLHHIDVFRRFGRFDHTLRLSADYDFLLRVLRTPGMSARFITGAPVARMYDGGASGRQPFRSRIEAMIARRNNAIPGLPFVLFWRLLSNARAAVVRSLLRACLGERNADRMFKARHQQIARRLNRELPPSPRPSQC